MYVVWKTRPLSGFHTCPFCGAAGTGQRFTYIPHLVASRRIAGKPSQQHLARLPSIRSCCLHSEAVVQQWWQQVDRILRGFIRPSGPGYILTAAQAVEIHRRMEERLIRLRVGNGNGTKQKERRHSASSPLHLAAPLRVLGLSWPCKADEVKAAFRQRAKQTHPDMGGRSEDFRAVYDAYDTLLKVVGGPLR